jgi:glycine cleavage system regulatory protein
LFRNLSILNRNLIGSEWVYIISWTQINSLDKICIYKSLPWIVQIISQDLSSIIINICTIFHAMSLTICFETKVLRSLDEILDRQKKLEEQVTSFLLTPGNSDDLLEDLVPKPINSLKNGITVYIISWTQINSLDKICIYKSLPWIVQIISQDLSGIIINICTIFHAMGLTIFLL